jgi:hypothetical protein
MIGMCKTNAIRAGDGGRPVRGAGATVRPRCEGSVPSVQSRSGSSSKFLTRCVRQIL